MAGKKKKKHTWKYFTENYMPLNPFLTSTHCKIPATVAEAPQKLLCCSLQSSNCYLLEHLVEIRKQCSSLHKLDLLSVS